MNTETIDTNKTTKKKRVLWADYAKCFGIIAVVTGHAINDVAGKGLDVTYNVIYWWHMPLFFMIGGFFLKKISHDFKGWSYLFGHRIKPLLIAYFLNGAILIILSHFFRQQSWEYTFSYFGRLIYGGSTLDNYLSVFWYMTTYMLAIFMTTLLISYVKKVWLQFAIAIGSFALGVALQDITFFGSADFPWDAQIALLAVFWMLLGYYVFKLFPKINWHHKQLFAFVGTLTFIGLIYLYATDNLDFVLWLKSSNIHNALQAFVIPPILCLVVFIACEGLEHLGNFAPITFIGKNTEIIMFYHRAAFDITTLTVFTDNWYFRIIIGLAAPILLAWLLRKFKNTNFYHRRQQLAEEKKSERVKIALPVTIGLSAVGAVWAFSSYQQQSQTSKNYVMSTTPTIFMHGWSSNLTAEQSFIKVGTEQNIVTEEMIIHVTRDNKLQVQGRLTGNNDNPVILVQFDNNRVGEIRYAQGLRRIVSYLKDKYNIKDFNAVGHSMGAYAWVYYGMHWGADPNLPRLNKMVVLAGPYNGILDKGHANQPKNGALAGLWDDTPHENSLDKNGCPKIIHEEYNTLLARKNNFPINTQVLNIYGDLKDGTSSDGLVTVQSTRALRYLVSDRARSYQEFEVTGEGGQHSRLHINNPVVNDKLTDYLWGK